MNENRQEDFTQDESMYIKFKRLFGPEVLEKLEGTEIWEFRTLYNKTYYRLFAFWDKDINTLVVATHGIVKKTQKTPQNEITKAGGIRKLYFENKQKQL